jgi:threonine/homoserine/homoserine lactone efflux protein
LAFLIRCGRLTAYEVALVDPKAILVFTAFFPQFVDRSAYATSFLLLGVTFLMLELVAIAIYALIGARLGTWAKGAQGFRWFNRVSGSVMIGFGLLLRFFASACGLNAGRLYLSLL